jgi:hypothetical protein
LPALQIVVFYCAKPGKTQVVAGDPTGPEQINLLYRSALAVNPDVGLTILTAPDTDLSALCFPHERIESAVDFDRLMFERTRMQKEYVERRAPDAPLAFLDSDILFCRDIVPLFAEEFDVALTWRVDREMPFNGGVIFVNNKRRQAGQMFFEALEDIYREKQRGRLEWYGDQYALTELVGILPERLASLPAHESRGIRFRFLPCELYNETPPNSFLTLLCGPRGAFLLHFKAALRRYMVPFWTFWLDPQRPRRQGVLAMLALALQFAATRRSYRHSINKDQRRFNLDSQDSRSWRERAAIAAEFLGRAAGPAKALRVLDIGCGDCKLQGALLESGLAADYVGYDLLPQSAAVRALDISANELPEKGDAVVSLGVVEYLDDPGAALKRFSRAAPWLVISHAARDLRSVRAKTAGRLNWRTYMTVAEFERALGGAGYDLVDRRTTPDQKTCVWLARKRGR